MKKRNNIINVLCLLIFINLFHQIVSDLTQFNSTELDIYNKLISDYDKINTLISQYKTKMQSIKLNLKLKSKYRNLKSRNEQLEQKISNIKKTVNGIIFNTNKIIEEINLLSNELDLLKEKFDDFVFSYNEYRNIIGEILGFIKIFFICFSSLVIVLLIILIIVGIYVYRRYRRNKYHTLIEEVSVKQERKFPKINFAIHDNNEKSDRSENKIKEEHDESKKEKIEIKV